MDNYANPFRDRIKWCESQNVNVMHRAKDNDENFGFWGNYGLPVTIFFTGTPSKFDFVKKFWWFSATESELRRPKNLLVWRSDEIMIMIFYSKQL